MRAFRSWLGVLIGLVSIVACSDSVTDARAMSAVARFDIQPDSTWQPQSDSVRRTIHLPGPNVMVYTPASNFVEVRREIVNGVSGNGGCAVKMETGPNAPPYVTTVWTAEKDTVLCKFVLSYGFTTADTTVSHTKRPRALGPVPFTDSTIHLASGTAYVKFSYNYGSGSSTPPRWLTTDTHGRSHDLGTTLGVRVT